MRTRSVFRLLVAFVAGWWLSVRFTDSIDTLGDIDEKSGIG